MIDHQADRDSALDSPPADKVPPFLGFFGHHHFSAAIYKKMPVLVSPDRNSNRSKKIERFLCFEEVVMLTQIIRGPGWMWWRATPTFHFRCRRWGCSNFG
jgi:hypothetical protein